jgi:osmotically inducible protein OsmC
MNVLYTAEALATGDGRNGHARSSDGILDFDLATPTELGGRGGATNPEQLFAAGYAACFHNALRRAAREYDVDAQGSHVTARVGLGPTGNGTFGIAVSLAAVLPLADQATAEQVMARGHAICPYSNAIRGNVEVELSIVGESEAAA